MGESSQTNVYNTSGSIGAQAPGLAQMILQSDVEIAKIGIMLQGYRPVFDKDRTITFEQTQNASIHTLECIGWFQGKISIPLSKNTSLSNIKTESDMHAITWSMQEMFIKELLAHWNQFHLDDKKYLQLASMHLDLVDFANRHPLGAGIRGFIGNATNETFQRVEQRLTEEKEKTGVRKTLGI